MHSPVHLAVKRPINKYLDHLPTREDVFINKNNIEVEFEVLEKHLI